jgi:hypothetical protein
MRRRRMINNFCPECGKSLYHKKRCNCGWIMQEINPPSQADYLCHYRENGVRCASLGTICPQPYAKSPWYCRDHWQKNG